MSLRFAISKRCQAFRRYHRKGDATADRESRHRGHSRGRRARHVRRPRKHRRGGLLPKMAERAARQHLSGTS
jgi:hypothetical protein